MNALQHLLNGRMVAQRSIDQPDDISPDPVIPHLFDVGKLFLSIMMSITHFAHIIHFGASEKSSILTRLIRSISSSEL